MLVNGIYIGIYKRSKRGSPHSPINPIINKFESSIVDSNEKYAYYDRDTVVYLDYAKFNNNILILDKYDI